MRLEITTPEKNVFSGEVDLVTLPGKEGQFQILKDHAPMVSTLATGELVYEISGKKESITVEGGVVQVQNNKVLVLAEGVI
ncbi:ATP synthase F1 subunit epsilon [Leadbetterella byssophila]|jgi:F-type H+-transporting ATPase subunit epsilon|uniref:ATP synthase F1 subcomplex epsilon subunit n=1 Tax=Leadbetterella byssophila (strain DSM 17132 / JCM 16389 / KACC 11308 / NBRC 106382 / 4M15) TaxID=649349 RepID=E4RQZ0_LEAB4|nr:ATP synthase F1 subunit epsilon [Leadbetterella byssophila]ADQ18433.1 ATP synthase F1 subcomplex epsilon subunit [Leadbetterella byssophila DSM 17132]